MEATTATGNSRRRVVRRVADVVHRWLGLTCGAIFVIAGLTGTLLSFYIEIERNVFPDFQTDDPHALPVSYEAVYQKLATLPSDPGGYWKIEIPPDGGVITSRYYATGAKTRMVSLDPVSLEVLRDAHWRDTFFTWIYDLHMSLLMGPTGEIIMGIVCLLLLLMLVAGLVSWLVPFGSWKAKFTFNIKGSAAQITYGLHKLVGVVSAVLLILVLGTAIFVVFPDAWVRSFLSSFSQLHPSEPPVVSTQTDGAQRVSVDQVIAQGLSLFPGSRVVWIRVPSDAAMTYHMQIRQQGAPMTRFPKTHVYVDQYSGQVLTVYDPKQAGAGDTIINWTVPLHDGKAFGMIGRIWVMVLGLVPMTLFITGFLRWNHKRRSRREVAARRKFVTPPMSTIAP